MSPFLSEKLLRLNSECEVTETVLHSSSLPIPIPGVLILVSIIVFHQSVLSLLATDHAIPLHYELSWSVACVGSAGAILILGGVLFLLLSLPFNLLEKCAAQHRNSNT